MIRERRFAKFHLPVDTEDAEDYYEIIENPMCLTDIMNKIDREQYKDKNSFMADIELIRFNAIEYNPDKDLEGMFLFIRKYLLNFFKVRQFVIMQTRCWT